MDPRLLAYYNRELQHVRELGGEFARSFPKIAGRLGLDEFECADPYVERLLEGLAFLAARVQLKMDAHYPDFAHHLFEIVYPHYVAPTPSMAIVQFQPDPNEGALAEGVRVPRGTMLRAPLGKAEQTACRYQTTDDVSLWPLEIRSGSYFSRDEALRDVPDISGTRAGLRLRLATTGGWNFQQLALDSLRLFLRGRGDLTVALYEQLLANTLAIVIRPADAPGDGQLVLDRAKIRRVGFQDDQALLPYGPRSFQGYRLLHEYFALPERFLSVELTDLQPVLQRAPGRELEIFVLFDRVNRVLEHRVDASLFALHTCPAINLFPRRADRIHLDQRQAEFHVVPDRTRPLDYEPYQVREVIGYGEGDLQQEFAPFYAALDRPEDAGVPGGQRGSAYYTVRRNFRVLSEKQRDVGARTSYIGSEMFLALVDAQQAPYRSDLRQLGVSLLCTNRDLPLLMSVGAGSTDFSAEVNLPIRAIRILAGPTRPRPPLSYGSGEVAWRLLNHLSLNYASLVDDPRRGGAAALRELLALYANLAEPHVRKQIEGVRSAVAQPVIRPIVSDGPLAFARGMQVNLTLDEASFEGTGGFLLGAVLEEFFARYVSINSFTETVVHTVDRGEIMRWPTRIGRRQSF